MSRLWRMWGWMVLGLLASPTSLADSEADAVSRHRGKKGGVTVLWPRVVPQTEDPQILAIAETLQGRLDGMAQASVDPKRVVVRPDPERVCPRAGCRSVSLGAVLGHQDGGCFAVGLVGLAEGGAVQLVPWGGRIKVRAPTQPFRKPPESSIAVTEFVPCDRLIESLSDTGIERALAAVLQADAAP